VVRYIFAWTVDWLKGTFGMATMFSRRHTTGFLPLGSLNPWCMVTSHKALLHSRRMAMLCVHPLPQQHCDVL
jgi:hypothetical protein